MNAESGISWRPLRPAEFPAVTELAEQCLAADGGQPFAADPDFLHRWYVADAESQAAWADGGGRLVCVSSLRWLAPSDPAGPKVMVPVTTGLVHPEWRRRGLGGAAYDWAVGRAGQREIQAESESLSDGAHALYESGGLAQVLAEDVMQLASGVPLPAPRDPGALTLTEWGAADPARFYAVYAEVFRDRPGFPGWSQQRWIDWISDDEGFRPQWSLLASLGGSDVGFIAGDVTGWITQLGVRPAGPDRPRTDGACPLGPRWRGGGPGRLRAARLGDQPGGGGSGVGRGHGGTWPVRRRPVRGEQLHARQDAAVERIAVDLPARIHPRAPQ
jgi:GNAT superfamily N-acetyltransferase